MKQYIIKSEIFNDYFLKVEPNSLKHYNIYWSNDINDAKRYDTKKDANTALGMLQGMSKDDLGLIILEVDKDEYC